MNPFSAGRNRLQAIRTYFRVLRNESRISFALSRAAATSQLRTLDPTDPSSWEFSAFSQNGEDGIIDYLLGQLAEQNRYFVEIGAASGLENNTAWLAVAKRYSGLMVEANPRLAARCAAMYRKINLGVTCLNLLVEPDNVGQLLEVIEWDDPDLLSIDIDGNDYYVARALMEAGLRPKIFVAEYNSAFGPDLAATIEYRPPAAPPLEFGAGLYYGVSIAGWRTFFARYGYQFVSVEQNGVNAFFVDPRHFSPTFLDNLAGIPFRENFFQREPGHSWKAQLILLQKMPLHAIADE